MSKKKKAYLVKVSLMTRVIEDEKASDYDIIESARDRLRANLAENLHDNVEEITEDTEVPYDPKSDG